MCEEGRGWRGGQEGKLDRFIDKPVYFKGKDELGSGGSHL